jgi:hypothetical protein
MDNKAKDKAKAKVKQLTPEEQAKATAEIIKGRKERKLVKNKKRRDRQAVAKKKVEEDHLEALLKEEDNANEIDERKEDIAALDADKTRDETEK